MLSTPFGRCRSRDAASSISFAAAFVIHDGAGHWLLVSLVSARGADQFFRSHATGYRLHLADCELYPFFVVTTVVFG